MAVIEHSPAPCLIESLCHSFTHTSVAVFCKSSSAYMRNSDVISCHLMRAGCTSWCKQGHYYKVTIVIDGVMDVSCMIDSVQKNFSTKKRKKKTENVCISVKKTTYYITDHVSD